MKREVLEKIVRKKLELWGYKEARIPIISEDIWKKEGLLFFEKNGKFLTLRPEITSEILKNTKAENKPLRLFYMGPIFSLRNGEIDEKFQIGWELIYRPSIWRDLEVLLIIKEVLEELKIQNYILEVGNTRIWDPLWNIIGDENKIKKLKNFLIKRDFVSIFDEIKNFSKDIKNIIQELVFFSDLNYFNGSLVERELSFLVNFKNQLISLGFPKENIVINPALYRPFAYYDGIIFELYLEKLKNPLGGGGSYIERNKHNELLYGFGFAFLEENLLEVFNGSIAKEEVKYFIFPEKDFTKVYEEMRKEREKGIISIFIPKECENL